jgi:hypothetical protein
LLKQRDGASFPSIFEFPPVRVSAAQGIPPGYFTPRVSDALRIFSNSAAVQLRVSRVSGRNDQMPLRLE